MTDRATSTMLSYTLTLAIITLLVSGVFVAAGGYVEDQHQRSIEAELDVLGNRLASDIAAVDRMALFDDDTTIDLTVAIPQRVAGTSYRVAFESEADGLGVITLTTTDPDVTVTVTVKLAHDLAESDFTGGDVTIGYDGGDIEVNRA